MVAKNCLILARALKYMQGTSTTNCTAIKTYPQASKNYRIIYGKSLLKNSAWENLLR